MVEHMPPDYIDEIQYEVQVAEDYSAPNRVVTGLVGAVAALALVGTAACGAEAPVAAPRASVTTEAPVAPRASATTKAPTSPRASATELYTPDPHLLVLQDNPARQYVGTYPKLSALAKQPTARWLYNGSDQVLDSLRGTMDQATKQHKTPVIVLYNIPNRDCASDYSKGGADSSATYRTWVDNVAEIIGNRPAITVVEPDALASINGEKCDATDKKQRIADVAYAAGHLNTPENDVYIDMGHGGTSAASDWPKADVAASLYKAVDGAHNADGIAVNTSNYYSTEANSAYVGRISEKLGNASIHYVVDTSRNGNEEFDGHWCNPTGRSVGHVPTTTPDIQAKNVVADALIWANLAGGSDGDGPECNGGGPAGSWDPKRALAMLKK